MGWDFSTEPEFQKKLDWVEQFCREEVEPLDMIFPYAVRSKDPKIKALVKPLQDQVKEQGLWAIFLDKELGGPGYGHTRAGRYAISSDGGGFVAQPPRARISAVLTVLPSSNRNRFSSRIFSDMGSLSTSPTPAACASGRLKY